MTDMTQTTNTRGITIKVGDRVFTDVMDVETKTSERVLAILPGWSSNMGARLVTTRNPNGVNANYVTRIK